MSQGVRSWEGKLDRRKGFEFPFFWICIDSKDLSSRTDQSAGWLESKGSQHFNLRQRERKKDQRPKIKDSMSVEIVPWNGTAQGTPHPPVACPGTGMCFESLGSCPVAWRAPSTCRSRRETFSLCTNWTEKSKMWCLEKKRKRKKKTEAPSYINRFVTHSEPDIVRHSSNILNSVWRVLRQCQVTKGLRNGNNKTWSS